MKKIFSFLMLAFTVLLVAQSKPVPFQQLPKTSQQLISTYFGKQNVSVILLDDDYLKKEYEVILVNGTKIEFKGNGNWKEVKSKKGKIPTGFIPKKISIYVQKSFPNTGIKKIEKNRFSYEVELINGIDLKFDLKGNFIKFDD